MIAGLGLADLIGAAFAAIGGVLALGAAIGLMRLPDPHQRTHCLAALGLVAAPLTVIGLAVAALGAGRLDLAARLLVLIVALIAAAAASAHFAAAAARAADLVDGLRDPAPSERAP